MRSILETCQPRADILGGTFNPEIFTASLSQVMDRYRDRGVVDSIYTDAEQFFREATYPTEGLCRVLRETFGRLSGDNSIPALHRLENAFGGGKTHILISLVHLGFRGKELASVAESLVDPDLLLPPGEVDVVGVAGDELAIHKPQGTELVPYTLWGEIAFQVGGEELYRQVETAATSYGSPGREYFDAVLGGRKTLIMLDEVAQYATRLEAARPNGAESLASFLMSLHGYARNHPGISVVLTLAGQSDAFSRQTKTLAQLIRQSATQNKPA